jgi:catechol-2,3-dioxygenase
MALITPKEHPSHVAFKVESRDELQELAAKNSARIVIHRDQSESFYLTAPGGSSIEIIYYPPK